MDWNIHHRIARLALKSRMLDFDVLSEILSDLGARAAAGEEVSVAIWCTSEWLTEMQLRKLLTSLGMAAISRELSNMDLVRQSEAEEVPQFEQEETRRFESTTKGRSDVVPAALGEGRTEPVAEESEPGIDEPVAGFEANSTATIDIGMSGGLGQTQLGAEDTLQNLEIELGFEATGLYRAPPTTSDLLEIDERYELGAELGRGGGGRVVEALDRRLKRRVAMKIFERTASDSDLQVRRFLAEAQAACQLEHPNIMPIYDVGVRADGSIYYTMLLVRQHSLEDVLTGLRNRDPEYVPEYTRARLLSILQQISRAIAYAHDRGVIHRDLKPGNIMLGEFGEVLVMDWGLAHVSGDGVSTELSEQGEDLVDKGQTLGTPAYMSPEQAKGRLDEVDEQSDVYSLGAILYEILVLEPPFERENPLETMWSVIESRLIPPREQTRHGLWDVPEDLEKICLKALQRRRDERYSSAGALVEALEAFTSGIRPRRAQRCLEQGRQAVERYAENIAKIANLSTKIEQLVESIKPWESIERKRRLWRLEDERDALAVDRSHFFGEAVTEFQKALANDPQCAEARTELAELYWERYCEAESEGDGFEQIYFGALLQEAGDEKYLRRFSSQVKLRIETRPEGANATLFPLEEIDRRLVVADERDLGKTPVAMAELEVGSYLMVFEAPDKAVVRAPLCAQRGEAVDMKIYLPPAETVSPGFGFIPGGPCFIGGDAEAINPQPRKKVDVPSFFCARMPVTFREYLEFLDAVGPELANRHLPRRTGEQSWLVQFDDQTKRWIPAPFDADAQGGRQPSSDADRHWELPVVGIDVDDARAYCRWRSQRDGRSYRLPTEYEWEKAGRGVDGRFFPWGDHFDATFCKMQDSRPKLSQMEPVGAFVDDVSPYGIHDLSGGVREWCEPSEDGAPDVAPIRGGAWNRGQRSCRLASATRVPTGICAQNIGLRLVYDVEFEDGWTGTHRVRISEDF